MRTNCCAEEDKKLRARIDIVSSKADLLLLGDFNLINLPWPNLRKDGPGMDPRERVCAEWPIESTLEQYVTEPTRYREGNKPPLLDLILSNDETLVSGVEIGPPIGKSHHVVLKVLAQVSPLGGTRSEGKEVRNWAKADYEGISEGLRCLRLRPEELRNNGTCSGLAMMTLWTDTCRVDGLELELRGPRNLGYCGKWRN